MTLNELLHNIVAKMDIHSGDRDELHKQVDATTDKPKDETDGGSSE
jgi:hypothetical protein